MELGTFFDVVREVVALLNRADHELTDHDELHAQLDVLAARNLLLDAIDLRDEALAALYADAA